MSSRVHGTDEGGGFAFENSNLRLGLEKGEEWEWEWEEEGGRGPKGEEKDGREENRVG